MKRAEQHRQIWCFWLTSCMGAFLGSLITMLAGVWTPPIAAILMLACAAQIIRLDERAYWLRLQRQPPRWCRGRQP